MLVLMELDWSTYRFVWPSPWTSGKQVLIENCMGICVQRIVRVHEQVVALVAWRGAQVNH